MGITAKLDEFGRPAWIVLIVLGFWAWWPIGLATLAYAIGSGRMGSSMRGRFCGWFKDADKGAEKAFRDFKKGRSSGNRAFDDYRTETLRRLEDEEREFRDFLDRLRKAKDQSEFEQFMADRRRGSSPTAA